MTYTNAAVDAGLIFLYSLYCREKSEQNDNNGFPGEDPPKIGRK